MTVAYVVFILSMSATSRPTGNLLKNGGFEDGLSPWRPGCLRGVPGNAYARSSHATVSLDTTAHVEGRQSARFDSELAYDDTNPRVVLEQPVPNLPVGAYRLSVRYRAEVEPGEGFGLVLFDWISGGRTSRTLQLSATDGTTWRVAQSVFRLTAPKQQWRVLLYLKGKGRVWYDDARLVRITETEYARADKLGSRDYHIETALVEGGKPRCVIVSSGRAPAYDAMAKRVGDRIRELCGIAPTVLDAERVDVADVLAKSNAVVLGNLTTSRFIETLYWQWYTLLDLWYPGRGGHVVRTVHDPYGTGKNVILLGGSDAEGVAAAAEAFCRTLDVAGRGAQSGTLKIGRLMTIKLGAGHEIPAAGEWVDPRLRLFHPDLTPPNGYTEASRAGLVYYYNGDERAGRRFRSLALDTDVLTSTDHYKMYMHAIVWDLIEEGPIFSDDDRRRITDKLLAHARGRDGTAGISRLLNYPTNRHLLDRHTSMQAICTLTASRYFAKHWPFPEWEENLRAVRVYFDRQMTTGKGDSDLGGRGIYSYFECALIPALLMRDRRLIDSGAMRHYAELCLMHCDNTGYMPSTGQSSFDSYPTCTFQKCAALLNDGGFLATKARRAEAEKIGGFTDATAEFAAGQAWATGVEPAPMDKMIGVYRLPLTVWEHEVRGKSIPIAKSFDKLTMRTGFDRDDQYLLLDGLHGGPSGKPYPNVNSIANFGQNGRTFLVSSIGGQNPVNHNVVTVCRDGYGAEAGRVASLEAMADLPGFGYSHTRAARHVFSSWDRHIFWRKGAWFVVLDRIAVTRAGWFTFECQWRSIGEPAMLGSNFTATVWEHAKPNAPRDVLTIKNADGLPLRFSEQGSGLFGGPSTKRWRHYCRRGAINRLRQVADRDMSVGDRQVFTNLVYVGGDRTRADYDIVKIDEHVVALTGTEPAYVGLTGGETFERAGLVIDGEAFCVTPTHVAVVNATRIRWTGIDVTASPSANLELNHLTGRVTVESTPPVAVVANDVRYAFEAGTHQLNLQVHTDELMASMAEQIKRDADAASVLPPTTAAKASAERPAIPTAWSHQAGAAVMRLHAGDVDGDGRIETLAGLADGRAVCLDDRGKRRWSFATGGAVRAIAHARLDAGPAVLVGSDDEHVYAVKPDGSGALWKHKCRLPKLVYTWWTTGMKATLRAILADDLDGDGRVEIVCGTGGGCVETIGADGKARWMTQIQWGIPDRLAVVPMPGGGKTLLVDNGYSSCGSTTWRLAANGKLLSSNACPTGRGSWDMTAIPGLKVADLNADGKPEVIVGRKGAYNEVGLYDAVTGKRKWLHTLGDAANALATLDVNGDGVEEVIVGSPSAWLCAFDLAGKQVWARRMPHEVVAIVSTGAGLLVACADAVVYRVDLDGRIQASRRLKGQPLWHFAIAGPHRIIADAAGQIVALKP